MKICERTNDTMTSAAEESAFLQIASENDTIPDPGLFIKWINDISQETDVKSENIVVRLVDEAESQALNHQFRGKNSATNVLSFPTDLPAEIEPDYLGDIVICAPVVEQEALDQNKLAEAHWAHMLVHGILHLKGYDHIQADQATLMESLEKHILAQMGFPDPYAE